MLVRFSVFSVLSGSKYCQFIVVSLLKSKLCANVNSKKQISNSNSNGLQ